MEGRPLFGVAEDFNAAGMTFHDTVNHCEPHAGAFPLRLGCEIGFKNPLKMIDRDALACVRNAQADIIACGEVNA